MNPAHVPQAIVSAAVLELFDETFERVQGIYLDQKTSLFGTLSEVSAEQASQRLGREPATIAAHVAHVIVYLEAMEHHLLNGEEVAVDWGEVWRTVRDVDAEGWTALRGRLQNVGARVRARLTEGGDWGAPDRLALALAMIVHTAHHLGEIRQALAWVRA